jgi:hypothetical protein
LNPLSRWYIQLVYTSILQQSAALQQLKGQDTEHACNFNRVIAGLYQAQLDNPTQDLVTKVDCQFIRSFIPPALINNKCLLVSILAVCQVDYRFHGTNIWERVTPKLVSNSL